MSEASIQKSANLGENRNIKNWNTIDKINEMLRKHFDEEPAKSKEENQ